MIPAPFNRPTSHRPLRSRTPLTRFFARDGQPSGFSVELTRADLLLIEEVAAYTGEPTIGEVVSRAIEEYHRTIRETET